jgi:hypothetical protein
MTEFDIVAMKPADTPDYMIPAWLACIAWALSEPGALAQFRADTGNSWTPPRTGIDAMVDEATGARDAFMRQFVVWVNEKVWGPIDGPGGE